MKDVLGTGVARVRGGGDKGPLGFPQFRASCWRLTILGEIILFWCVFSQGDSPDQLLPWVLAANTVGAGIVLLVLAWFRSCMRRGAELTREIERQRRRRDDDDRSIE